MISWYFFQDILFVFILMLSKLTLTYITVFILFLQFQQKIIHKAISVSVYRYMTVIAFRSPVLQQN